MSIHWQRLGAFTCLSLALGAVCALVLVPRERTLVAAPESARGMAEPHTYECRWTDQPIQLDGSADEPAWKQAQVVDNFLIPGLGKETRKSAQGTRARVLWDAEYFYFHADMDDTELFADVKEHDGPTWKNDCFELFFHPDRQKPGYYEFEVSPLNTQLDAFFPKRDLDKSGEQVRNGRFRMETAVKLRGKLNPESKDQGWSVEGRIPWLDFLRTGGRPRVGETWGFSLCRVDYGKDGKAKELSTISPIQEKKLPAYFHQYEDYASLKFVGQGSAKEPHSGLAKRTPLKSSTVVGSPDPLPPFKVQRAVDVALEFPIMARVIPGTKKMLVLTQPAAYGPTTLGRFNIEGATQDKEFTKLLPTPEGGTAYDICFHPDFAKNRFVYIGWNGPGKGKVKNKFTRITRYTLDAETLAVDEKSATTIIEWESDGHNGGALCFGTDGMMYVTSGDGTSDSDTDEMGQRTDVLLAKCLRIDVDHPAPGKQYSVPKDNPFVKDERFAPETWAYGLRNPWRIACDPKTGHIWIGNNGQDLWEQAYFVRKGENYGWSVVEGSHSFYEKRKPGPTPITKPTAEHHHSEFRSLTGGLVYHGKKHPELAGAYIYGDYSTGRIWGIKHDGDKVLWHKELAQTTLKISGFCLDQDGELLVIDHASKGGFFALVPTPKELPKVPFPKTLSESGLFDSVKDHTMKAGVVPYSVNAPFWSDGMIKSRFIAVPDEEKVKYTRSRGWNFPDRTVIVKSFALEQVEGDPKSRKWIETRFMTKQDGEWYGYSYLWNDAGTDATLVAAGGMDKEFTIRTQAGEKKQVWHYPSRAECMVCHSRAANFVLGLCSLQMNKLQTYDGGAKENQLAALARAGYLEINWKDEARQALADRAAAEGLKGKEADDYIAQHLPQPGQREVNPEAVADLLPHLVDPQDPKQDLTKRARSFLHSNCASCHVEAGGGNAQMQLEYTTALDKMKLLGVKPIHFPFDLKDPKLVDPGKPENSVLLKRMAIRGQHQMPPIGSNRLDEDGIKLMRAWIESVK